MGSLNTTPATYTNGTVLTAATLNTEIKSPMTILQSAWTSFTPLITAATTNPTMGNSVREGAYHRIGKCVWARWLVSVGSTYAVGSGAYHFNFPVTAATTIPSGVVGGGYVYDNSANLMYVCTLRQDSATTFTAYYPAAGTGGAGYTVGSANPWIPGTSDQFNFFLQYEAA